MTLDSTIASLRSVLGQYTFRATSEADLQQQVLGVLRHAVYEETLGDAIVDTEVRRGGGRFDVLLIVRDPNDKAQASYVVLELKLKAGVAAVERQAMRYAKMDDVDAVGVVTTSSTLTHGLSDTTTLGAKPFFVINLRSS